MKVEVRGKNYKVSDNLVMIVEKKFAKLDKYFPEEITAEVLTKREADHFKIFCYAKIQYYFFLLTFTWQKLAAQAHLWT